MVKDLFERLSFFKPQVSANALLSNYEDDIKKILKNTIKHGDAKL